MRRCIATWLVLALGLLVPVRGRVQAQASAADSARADELFSQGRERLASGDYAQACPLLEQSYALDPATGGLLALALCHEKAGQPSAALIAYREVLTRAESEQRPDRARAARAKIALLEPATASLRVEAGAVASEPGLQLSLDGQPVALAQLERALPIDAGERCLEAAAPEKQPWRACITASAGERHALTLPALVPVPASAPVAAPVAAPTTRVNASARRTAVRADEGAARPAPAEWAGIALLSAGGVGFVTSIGFVLRANHQRDLGDLHCTGTCTPEGEDARSAEERARDGALISGMVGLAAAVTGVVTYVWGRHTRGRPKRHASAAPAFSPGMAGLSVRGRF